MNVGIGTEARAIPFPGMYKLNLRYSAWYKLFVYFITLAKASGS